MYIPTAFREGDLEKLVGFMRANSFATLVSNLNGVIAAAHIPMVVSVEGDVVKLTGHLARANPQWQTFEASESLAIFTGPHAYIAPTLYEQHENVPTWNYIAVHAYGVPKIITRHDAPEQMDQIIDAMLNTYSTDYKAQWHSLSDRYREGMMQGIVGFEMAVTHLEGKYKLSQNRSHVDQSNVAHTLLQSADPSVHAIGVEMQRNLEGHEC
jgi:transcriptional regulator